TIHEWAGLWTSGERYRVGEHVLLFLYLPGKLGLTSPVAGAMGRFATDSQGRIVLNARHVAALADDPILGGKTVIPYTDFIQAIRRSGGRNEPDVTLLKSMAVRSFLFRLASAPAIVLFFAALARSGCPEYVAGPSYFNSGTMGQSITWSLGQVNYYTDQGDLSPILPNASAKAFVASAFSQWTSVSTAALTATNAGQLAEDVTGSNIAVNSSGAVTAPADITPSATQTPVGIV